MPYLPLGSFWNHRLCSFLKTKETFSGFHFPTAVCICPMESHTYSGSTEIGISFYFDGHGLRERWNCRHCTCPSPVFPSLKVTVDSWRIQQNGEFSFWWTSYYILFLSVKCLITIISFQMRKLLFWQQGAYPRSSVLLTFPLAWWTQVACLVHCRLCFSQWSRPLRIWSSSE